MPAAVIYLRVSREDQVINGNGLDAQLDICIKHCDRQGWAVAAVCRDEGISGSKGLAERPGLLEAISALSRGDFLLVAKRDRLGRLEPMAMAMIEAAIRRRGARVVSVAGEGTESNDPAAVLMRRMVDAFAEYERLIIGARTKAGLAVKKRRGERVSGRLPYGFDLADDGVALVPNEAEQAVVRRIRDLRAAGVAFSRIAAALSSEGIRTKTGKSTWDRTTVSQIFERIK